MNLQQLPESATIKKTRDSLVSERAHTDFDTDQAVLSGARSWCLPVVLHYFRLKKRLEQASRCYR